MQFQSAATFNPIFKIEMLKLQILIKTLPHSCKTEAKTILAEAKTKAQFGVKVDKLRS